MNTKPEPPTDPQRFGWRHLLSIAAALAITLMIVALRDDLRDLNALGYAGAFLAMLIGNATVILPVPGLIFVFLLGGTLNPLLVGLAAGPGAALGELTGYAAGFGGSAVIDDWPAYHAVEGWMTRYGPIIISLMAAVPNPLFDMAGIAAGALRLPWWQFLLAAWIGKTAQGLLVALAGFYSIGWVEGLLR
ncbi:MAG: VTT domain-containing protein [Chloroflexi bacterium]|nr:VTT domain-containing protein [Chloroflexota bacterium]